MKMRKTFFIWAVGVIFTIGALGTLGVYFFSKGYISAEIITSHQNEIAQYLKKIDRALLERSTDLRLIATQIQGADFSRPQQIEKQLIDYRNIRKVYAAISIFTDNGMKIIDTSRLDLGKKFDNKYIANAIKSNDVVLSYEISEVFNHSYIVFSKSTRDKKGHQFIVVSYVPITNIIRPDDSLFVHNAFKSEVQLQTKHDNTLIFSNSKNVISRDAAQHENPEYTKISDSIYLEESSEYLTFLAQTDVHSNQILNDWIILIRNKKSELFSFANKITMIIAGVFIFLLVLSIAVMYFLGSRLVKPIENILQNLQQLGKGNFDVFSYATGGAGEVAEIESAINSMAIELKQTISELNHQSRLAAIGQLSGEIAHEINNPLAIISGHCDLLLMQMSNGKFDLKKSEANFIKIKDTVFRITQIVRGMRTLARNDHNDLTQTTSVADLLNNTADFCRESLRAKNIELTVLSPTEPLELECRAVQLSQVLLNLINNASDAIKDTYDKKWIELEANLLPESIVIKVTNSGPKIDEALSDKIFNPFFTTKKSGSGTGMGLSISRKIIKNHHGRIFVDHKALQTCFVVELPRTPAVNFKQAV